MNPAIQPLIDQLPIMKAGKPRRFRLFCECYEWVFNRTCIKYHRAEPGDIDHNIEYAERLAGALWDHQAANPGDFAKPIRLADMIERRQ